ncbi:MAG: MFS transporter [Clostridia bacterium]|nr:MFS transporter [Clostridia bacterium]
MSEKELNKNVKLYPSYRAFAYDFLFLWTISILYLTEVKGLSYSQVIFLDSIFMLASFGFQIPITKLIKKLGRVPMARLASITWLGFSFIYLFGEGFPIFIFANILYGFGNSIRNITDIEIVSLSLKQLNRKRDFAKIEGKAMFIYNIIEAFSSILAGYLYEFVNPYAPMIGTVICCGISTILSFIIKDPLEDEPEEQLALQKQEENKSKREPSYKALLKRPFVIAMIIFCFSCFGMTSVQNSLAKIYFQDINTPAYLFGYIFCALKLISAFTYKYEFKYELKKGVRSLIIFVAMLIIAYSANAIIYAINPNAVVSIILITLMFVFQQIARSGYRIGAKNYINSCSSKNGLTKTLTIYSMSEGLGYAFVTMFISVVLELSNNSFVIANLALVGLLGIPMIVGVILFVRALIKSYMTRCTTIRKDLE